MTGVQTCALPISVGTGVKQLIVVGGNCQKEGLDAIGASNGNGWCWLFSWPEFSTSENYNHFMTPNTLSCTYPSDPFPGWGGVFAAVTASGNHPGGVNVGMADGSVRFVKSSINIQTWWGLGTRAGGEVLSSDSY